MRPQQYKQSSYQRERSRQRSSRDRSYGRESIGASDAGSYNRLYTAHQLNKKKRVKFDDEEDIRVFKKEDEPVAKSLSEEEIIEVKKKYEKDFSKNFDYNWDEKKHFDALSESNSIKEQKQKEKELHEKLMGMREEISFYQPFALSNSAAELLTQYPQSAAQSRQKDLHSERIKDVLGCFYTQISEIPNEPIFDLVPSSVKSDPKTIKFSPAGINDAEDFAMSKSNNKNERKLKGILKMPGEPNERSSVSEAKNEPPRDISPRLIWLLKDMQVNKHKYNKEMTDGLLRQYKESGELDYLMRNHALLTELLRNQPANVQPPPSNDPPYMQHVMNPYQPQHYHNQHNYAGHRGGFGGNRGPHMMNGGPGMGMDYQPKTDKYKTVPCKYYHSPQGCVKAQNCTFIHDEQYAGQSTPSMLLQAQSYGYLPPQTEQPRHSPHPMAPYNSFNNNSHRNSAPREDGFRPQNRDSSFQTGGPQQYYQQQNSSFRGPNEGMNRYDPNSTQNGYRAYEGQQRQFNDGQQRNHSNSRERQHNGQNYQYQGRSQ